MFGIFKKSMHTQDALLISIKVALICFVEEKENNGSITTPNQMRHHVIDIAKQELKESDIELIGFWASKILYEKNFIKELAARALQGPLGTFNAKDEEKIKQIVPEAFK